MTFHRVLNAPNGKQLPNKNRLLKNKTRIFVLQENTGSRVLDIYRIAASGPIGSTPDISITMYEITRVFIFLMRFSFFLYCSRPDLLLTMFGVMIFRLNTCLNKM